MGERRFLKDILEMTCYDRRPGVNWTDSFTKMLGHG